MLYKSLVYSPAFYCENTMFEEPGTQRASVLKMKSIGGRRNFMNKHQKRGNDPSLITTVFPLRVWMLQASSTITGQPTVGIQ